MRPLVSPFFRSRSPQVINDYRSRDGSQIRDERAWMVAPKPSQGGVVLSMKHDIDVLNQILDQIVAKNQPLSQRANNSRPDHAP